MKLTRRKKLSALGGLAVLPVGTSVAQEDGSPTEKPENPARLEKFLAQFELTDEQVEEITTMVEEMRSEDSTPMEIHQAVREKLVSFGVSEEELDEMRPNRHPNPGMGPGREISVEGLSERFDITEDQAQTIVDEVSTMEKNGTPRAKIHERVSELLESYDVDVSEVPVGRGKRGPRKHGFEGRGQKRRPSNRTSGARDQACNSESDQE
jgi:hypothetical protein